MRSGRRSCIVHAAPEAVWDHLSDYSSVLDLSSATARSRILHGRPGVKGCKYDASLHWEGLKSEFSVHLVHADRPRSLEWSSRSHGATCGLQIELEKVEEGTRVVATLEYGASRANFPLEPFAWGLLSPMFDRTMRRLGRLELTR